MSCKIKTIVNGKEVEKKINPFDVPDLIMAILENVECYEMEIAIMGLSIETLCKKYEMDVMETYDMMKKLTRMVKEELGEL